MHPHHRELLCVIAGMCLGALLSAACRPHARAAAALLAPGAPQHPGGPARPREAHAGGSTDGWKTLSVYVGTTTYGPQQQQQAWCSQAGQDETIADIFGHKRGGYFVDLAANDAAHLSNTLALEERYAWTGLCIEANRWGRRGAAGWVRRRAWTGHALATPPCCTRMRMRLGSVPQTGSPRRPALARRASRRCAQAPAPCSPTPSCTLATQ